MDLRIRPFTILAFIKPERNRGQIAMNDERISDE